MSVSLWKYRSKAERVVIHKVIVDGIEDPELAVLTAQNQVREDYV